MPGLISAVVDGIAYLHKNNIIHCDLKPENLLVPVDSPPLVADLGYAKYFAAAPPANGDRLTEITFTPKFCSGSMRFSVSTRGCWLVFIISGTLGP